MAVGKWQGQLAAGPERMFMPKRPYIPDGALRYALAYPTPPCSFTDQEFVAALTLLGLAHLSRSLDRIARWDR
jgi:vitamin B12/bleomycin/antimicrobial peptide transport system ATP-binding/permease protein